MKLRTLVTLLLAAALMVPAFAQQSTSAQSGQPSAQQDQQSATATQSKDQQDLATGKQPLTYESRQGFWGKINPFARKKYVQKQLSPIRDRVNELDELTAANSKMIKDVDSRAQQGIQLASSKANEADTHAVDAGNRAQQANQTAEQANQRLQSVSTVVGKIDEYQPATQVEIKFRPGQVVLSQKAKDALDQIATQVKDQKGYILEVQGFSSGRGIAAVRNSQGMADAVVRYMVLSHEIPVYRIYTVGMGNAPSPAQTSNTEGKTRRTIGGRVEIALLKNGLADLQMAATGSSDSNQSGVSGTSTSPSSQSTEQQRLPAQDMNPSQPTTPEQSKPQPTQPTPPPVPPQL
jgi:outer membrane protein OmpA-like peptidoglycan-associated protein